MKREELLQQLEKLARRTTEEVLSGVEIRKLKELEFHNLNRNQNLIKSYDKNTYETFYGNKKFYQTMQLSSKYVEDWIERHAKNKIFLDYACGNGVNTIRAAMGGADLAIGIDISEVSVKNARDFAEEKGVSKNTYFFQADCEATGLPNDCIDVCICSGMLHHLDLSNAFCELRRILKKRGAILVIEALNYNPLIKLYRKLTPEMRTEWGKTHILSYKDIEFAKRFLG